MARRPARRAARPAAATPAAPENVRDKIIAAFFALLAEKPLEQIGLAEIAARAEVSLVQLRDAFSSPLAIIAAHVKDTDRAVLGEDYSDMEEEPARERLFDVLMRRLEALAPHRPAECSGASPPPNPKRADQYRRFSRHASSPDKR